MNKENINRIVFFICSIILGGIGFFFGSTYEQTTHTYENNRLLDSIDVQIGVIGHFETNANYHAVYNYKSKEVTESCRKCAPLLTDIQSRLDSIEAYKGSLVVSEKSDTQVTGNDSQPIERNL